MLSLEPEEGEGMTWAVGRAPWERSGWKDKVVLELEWSSTLSEQDVPMPVSPLSEAPLWRLPRLLVPGAEEVPCHDDSHPGTHPGGLVLEPVLKVSNPSSNSFLPHIVTGFMRLIAVELRE